MCLSNPSPPLLHLKANELYIHWSWILLGLLSFLRIQQTSTSRWMLIGLLLDCSNVSCRLSLPWTTCWQSKQNLQTSETVWCVWSDFLRNTKNWKEKARFVFLPFFVDWEGSHRGQWQVCPLIVGRLPKDTGMPKAWPVSHPTPTHGLQGDVHMNTCDG